MEVVKGKTVGSVACNDDPELWLQPLLPDPRVNHPYRFMLSIDGRRIGLSVGNPPSTTESSTTGQEVPDRPTLVIRQIGLSVRYVSLVAGAVETNASKFASREQQDRAIEFFLGAVEHTYPLKHLTGEVLPPRARFSPNIQAGLKGGEFIE